MSKSLLSRLEALERASGPRVALRTVRVPYGYTPAWDAQILQRAAKRLGWTPATLDAVAEHDWPLVRDVAVELLLEGESA